jgi:heptaprenyl diphosphate synthase
MASSEKDITLFRSIIEENGRNSYSLAKNIILNYRNNSGQISRALNYFSKITLRRALPVFPALLSLSCKASGRQKIDNSGIGAAMSLMAWAADIHDDIIDQSAVKYGKQTVFGKFGTTVALLAGDALLVLGSTMLSNECENLDRNTREHILKLANSALLEISNAEIKETLLAKSSKIKPSQALNIIDLKATIPELFCRIGAILGEGQAQTVNALSAYGKAFGNLALILEEFIDLTDYYELENRIKFECLPLPLVYGLKEIESELEIRSLLCGQFSKEKQKELLDLVNRSKEVLRLKKQIRTICNKGFEEIRKVDSGSAMKDLTSLLTEVFRALPTSL